MIGAIVLALLAHLSYATNDLAGALGAHKLSVYRMALLCWWFGCIPFGIAALFLFRHELYLWPALINVFCAALIAFAWPIFLTAISKGNPTVNGVIAGIFPLWVVVFSLIFYNESLTSTQIGALMIIFPGIVLSSLHLTKKTRLNNLFNRYSLLAFLVSIMWGLSFSLIRQPTDAYGWFEAGFVLQVSGTTITTIWLWPKVRTSFRKLFSGKGLIWPMLNGASGFTGTITYTGALTLGATSVVAPIAGSYPGLYAIVSYLVFRQKLTKLQILGVVLTLSGVISLSIVSI